MKLLSIIKKTNIDSSFSTNRTYFYDNLDTVKHFPSSVREWNNSIFLFNKNALSLIPNMSKLAIEIITNYFYLYNKNLERKIRKKTLSRKLRKISNSKIFISKGEFKHTNNKVIITLYVFNKQKINYLFKLKNRYLNKFLKKILSYKKRSIFDIGEERLSNKLILLKKLNKMSLHGIRVLERVNRFKPKIVKILRKFYEKKKINKYVGVSRYVNKFYKKLIKKSFRKLIIYMYYRQLIYINNSKFNYTYLQYLKDKLHTLFNKNIEFNFINLKYFYLNSDILSESMMLKITKNRKNLLILLKKLKNKVKIQKKRVILGEYSSKKKLGLKQYFNNKLLESYVINNLKYKHITGFRLEAKGRLNKRYTASRSMYKASYEGNLLNLDSSYKGLSTVLLKGNLNSNLQFTRLNSKTRIGSFGLKGWVSGY